MGGKSTKIIDPKGPVTETHVSQSEDSGSSIFNVRINTTIAVSGACIVLVLIITFIACRSYIKKQTIKKHCINQKLAQHQLAQAVSGGAGRLAQIEAIQCGMELLGGFQA